jgi:hypothetical protein
MWGALATYGALAWLAQLTLEDPFRAMVWIFCGGLAVLTLVHSRDRE